ncbi:hypothetical protein U1Q18_035724 [Sarracenia purpurea var. burkii]
MDVGKQASNGGFLELFDRSVKSRKKLFPNKSELPEGLKEGNEADADLMTLHPQLMEVLDQPGPRGKRNNDHNLASSANSEEGYGTRAPSIVARLMGLDSLPTSTIYESCSTINNDSPFVRDSCSKSSSSNVRIEYHIINNTPNERSSRNLVESRLRKVQSRPIERFQTEMLPPKSAKPIADTHHRLLSPIKSPGFVPTSNAACIMEAAAKIIGQGPPSETKGKMPGFRSSSVPLRIQDLNVKMGSEQRAYRPPEAFQRPKEPISFEYYKVQHSERNRSGSRATIHYNASMSSEDSSESLKKKGKSVSLAVKAKDNVQRRKGLISSGNKSSINRKKGDEVRLGLHNRSQVNMQKSVQKRTSTSRAAADVLKQNNQKQNCVANKDRVAVKASVTNQQERKVPSMNGSVGPNKASNKVPYLETGCRKKNYMAKDTGKEFLSSKTNPSSQSKPLVHRDIHFEESDGKNLSISKDGKSLRYNVGNDVCADWDIVDRKNSMDVVSFTFTSPIQSSRTGSQSSGQVIKNNTHFCVDSCDVIDRDALSVLLEKKLEELSCRVRPSNYNLIEAGSAACPAFRLQDSMSTRNAMSDTAMQHCNIFQLNLQNNESSLPCDINCASADGLLFKAKQNWQGLEEMEGQNSSSNSEYEGELDCQYPSPISNLEPSSSDGTYNTSDCKTNSNANGCTKCLLAEAHGVKLSYSASSTSGTYMGEKDTSTSFNLIGFKRPSNWELDYITKILDYSDFIIEDFVLGGIDKIVTPNLFDELVNQKTGCDESAEECFKLGRKVLFDGVNECLKLWCEQLFGKKCKAPSKWAILFRRKEGLAEELHKEISSWTGMGDLMVDELVDKDMSSWLGRWVDFEIEAFEEGAEIEKVIMTCLVDELITDFLLI